MEILKVKDWLKCKKHQFKLDDDIFIKAIRIKDGKMFCENDLAMIRVDGLTQTVLIKSFSTDNIHVSIMTKDYIHSIEINDIMTFDEAIKAITDELYTTHKQSITDEMSALHRQKNTEKLEALKNKTKNP